MRIKRHLALSVVSAAFLTASLQAEDKDSLWRAFFKGAAEEAGSRIMGGIIDGLTSPSSQPNPQASTEWTSGAAHPRYPHIVSGDTVDKWKPAAGYVWADPTDGNDWTVIPAGASRAAYNAPPLAAAQQAAKPYVVVYDGEDGVNLRSSPGGFDIIATAFKTSGTLFTVISTEPVISGGIPWVKVRFTGWMARHNLRNGDINVATLQNSLGYVLWDGAGDPKDNFIAMKSQADISSHRLAKVYHNTSVRLGDSRNSGSYEWIEAELIGWAAVTSPRGTTLIGPR